MKDMLDDELLGRLESKRQKKIWIQKRLKKNHILFI